MPKISKARIVNFNYNDGNRLIADEIFDFSNEKDDDALNVLINLENGGGKSVLVQLMLQAIIPKAKVSGRKIESNFTKLSDHCFVALEWSIDDSREKLMTGIAISAREISSTEDETSGGMGVKYYTFCSNYSSDNDENSLVNLPLSKNDRGRFIPAEYESIKALARKNKGQITCYSSDDNPRWQKKLDEYGIYNDEWKMIEKLNSEEDGLGKYFSQFKTSDQLIDGLLIQTIEGKLKHSHSKEDSSLKTMLISHAKRYAEQENKIKEREEYEEFLSSLEALKPKSDSLGNIFYDQEEKVRLLFSLSSALNNKESLIAEKKSQTQKNISEAEEKIRHISWEKKSKEYYYCYEEREEKDRKNQELLNKKSNLKAKLNETILELKKEECAFYYNELCKNEAKVASLSKAIEQKRQGLESSDEIKKLGYSAKCSINERREELSRELEGQEGSKAKVERELEADLHNKKETANELSRLQSSYAELKGELNKTKEYTNLEVESLVEGIGRRLDGLYAKAELDELLARLISKRDDEDKEINSLEEKQAKVSQEITRLPFEFNECNKKIEALKLEKQNLENELREFEEKNEELRKICKEHSLEFSTRFSGKILEYLQSEEKELRKCQNEIVWKKELCNREIESARAGFLHIQKEIIEFLNSTGAIYQTCEKYLLKLVEDRKLSGQVCLEVLNNYPALAYGVIMDEEQKKLLFSYGRESWLPAMIPIFSPKQIEGMLCKEEIALDAIAFYAEEYFLDSEGYIAKLTRNFQEHLDKESSLIRNEEHIQSQIEKVKEFSYSEDWEKLKIEQAKFKDDEIKRSEDRALELKKKEENAKEEKKELDNRLAETKAKLEESKGKILSLEKVFKQIESEKALCEKINQKKQGIIEATERLKEWELAISQKEDEKQRLQDKINEVKAEEDRLCKAFEEVRDRQETKRIDGSWEELFDSYKFLIQNENSELDSLKAQLEQARKISEDYQNLIKKKELDNEDYKNRLYSKTKEDNLRKTKKELEPRLEEARNEYIKSMQELGEAKGKLESTSKALESFGGVLPKADVGENFKERSEKCRDEKEKLISLQEKLRQEEVDISKEKSSLRPYLEKHQAPERMHGLILEEDYQGQCKEALESYKQGEKELEKAKKETEEFLKSILSRCPQEIKELRAIVVGMIELLSRESVGDRYITLSYHIDNQIKNINLAISKIATDLKDFENSKNDLIRQCTFQGKEIYEGLQQMEERSRVMVSEGKQKRMIRFNFPEHIDTAISEANIAEEINKGTKELAEMLEGKDVAQFELEKYAQRIVGSKNLLRKYIGKESIQLEAYKIDQNPENSGYRKWRDMQINNSGAEKFVVYFAIILSLINYTRGGIGGIQDKELRSCLILDNPFGTTSSRHILKPMFAIAKHFRVQLICFSHIDKSDIINCFDVVINAIIKKRPMSTHELLTHEGNERIEHGYYRAEQMSLL